MSEKAIHPLMQDFQLACIDAEARRICDERGWRTVEDWDRVRIYLRRQAFMKEVEPLIQMKIRALSCMPPPKYIQHPDGRLEAEPIFLPEACYQIDGVIADIRKRYEV